MTNEDAKKALSFFRPGSADERDPAFAEAREAARNDPELRAWFEEHCANYQAVRARVAAISAPAGLREQIIAEQNIIRTAVWWRRLPVSWMAAAAAVAALLCLAPIFLLHHGEPDALTAFRNKMVGGALSPYNMDFVSTNQQKIRSYLAQKGAPADYTLPAGLAAARVTGCAIKPWNGASVSMICFNSGAVGPGAGGNDLWLFVVDKSIFGAEVLPATPEFAAVSRAETAAWSAGDRAYILVGAGGKSFLQKFAD